MELEVLANGNSKLRPMSTGSVQDSNTSANGLLTSFSPAGNPFISDAGPVVRNAWSQIRVGIIPSSAWGVSDGIYRVWVNEVLVAQTVAGNMTAFNGTSPILREMYFPGWANAGFTDETFLWVDDFKLFFTDPGWTS
jgi:hypothetical protein